MYAKRTFSLEPEVDAFLSTQTNRSKVINEIVKRYLRDIEQQDMITDYQAMNSPEARAEFQDWESLTLNDGLD